MLGDKKIFGTKILTKVTNWQPTDSKSKKKDKKRVGNQNFLWQIFYFKKLNLEPGKETYLMRFKVSVQFSPLYPAQLYISSAQLLHDS